MEEGEKMGTIRVPKIVPSPGNDCKKIEEAFRGWRTDTKEIIRILGCRNSSQRKKIREIYQHLYNKPLTDTLKSKLPHDYLVFSDFKKAVIMWTMDPSERDAKLANKSLRKKKGVDHLQVIIEIACASTPEHLIAVRQAYCSLYNCSLEEDITSNVSLPLRKLLLCLVSSYRYNREVVDANLAHSEATVLQEAIEKKKLYHDEVVLILSTRNKHQLKATFECYRQNYGNSIYQDIESSGTGNSEYILRLAILCIDTPEKHFVEVVRKSVVGLGTDEDSLTRAIVTRAEVDMMKIRAEYFNIYKSSLDNAVIGDTSGDYKDFLVTLLGGKI
ncbi:annexin D3-like [Macadamia integrifolia]|uniref:annexin D3-like n=1 Tax=Macadamia integrifolia TaxID=60698 RepID=UPI001C4FFF55|nr:annexin D3-like [Macadamia integrifolia]